MPKEVLVWQRQSALPSAEYETTVAEPNAGVTDIVGIYPDRLLCYHRTQRLFEFMKFQRGQADCAGWEAAQWEAILTTFRESLAPNAKLYVLGHAEMTEVSTWRDAEELALRRAQCVRQELIRRGLPPERLQAVSHGAHESAVIEGEDSAWLRRVGLSLTETEQGSFARLRSVLADNRTFLPQFAQRLSEAKRGRIQPALGLHAKTICLRMATSSPLCYGESTEGLPKALDRYFHDVLASGCQVPLRPLPAAPSTR